MLHNMSMADKDVSVCANCGKEGDEVKNICNKCRQVKYCNAACKKKHRHKHKKDCEEHIRLATEKHDKELFKLPSPLHEGCPICFLRMPPMVNESIYYSCCGKVICSGCAYAPVYDNQGNKVDRKICPFCRTPIHTSDEEMIERYKIRVEANDPEAIRNMGCYYRDGMYGLPQDYTKALELFHRAAELGDAIAYASVGYAYDYGKGVKVDKEKARHYYEIGAIMGCTSARHNLGFEEERKGNTNRALKHHMIAVRGGYSKSLKRIKDMYSDGYATKDEYTKALRFYQCYLNEVKSVQRDEAATYSEEYID